MTNNLNARLTADQRRELNFDAPISSRVIHAGTVLDNVAGLFCRRENEWIDVVDLAAVGGLGGWRSRVAECRTLLRMDIEWRLLKWPDGRNRSQYRYLAPSRRERIG